MIELLVENRKMEEEITLHELYTSNIGSPVSLDRALNSMIIVPAQAVQVSDSLPVPEDGWWIPYFRLTY